MMTRRLKVTTVTTRIVEVLDHDHVEDLERFVWDSTLGMCLTDPARLHLSPIAYSVVSERDAISVTEIPTQT